MHQTRNDMPQQARTEMAGLLNKHLAAAIDLQARCKHAHWNVKGPSFLSLHELFDRLAEQAEEDADGLAERCAALGMPAQGALAQVVKASPLPPQQDGLIEGRAHVAALAEAHAAYGRSLRAAIDTATAAGDIGTADLFTGLSRSADKNLWFLESHLQAEK